MVRDHNWTAHIWFEASQHPKQLPMGKQTVLCLRRPALLNTSHELGGVLSSRHADKMLHGLAVHVPFFPLQLCQDLVDLVLYLMFVLQNLQAVQKLLKSGAGVYRNRFHGVNRFQRFINAHRVVNLKVGFVDFRTQAGSPAHHLLEQDT